MLKNTRAFAMACLIGVGSALLSTSPSPAQSNDIDNLIQDIQAYKERCEPETSSPPPPSQSCLNEKAQLIERQHKLNLTDAELDAKLKARGFRGFR